MKVLVVGHGAREHAIAKKLAQDNIELYAAMGGNNPGIAELSKSVQVFDILKPGPYEAFKDVDIAFIGPDPVLAAGITDRLNKLEIPVMGPTREAAKLEWSKSYTRLFMDDHSIPGNPAFKVCRSLKDIRGFLKMYPEIAVKPDVLTGGKGVKLTSEHLHGTSEVEGYATERIRADGLVVLEEKLKGNEFTLQGFTDGKRVEVMPMVRDFKRAYDGDRGPNTGSMGSYSCPDHGLPDVSRKAVEKGAEIMKKTIRKMYDSVGAYKGVLYGGFMDTKDGVFLIEYNSRFGDPEAMNVLSLLQNSLLDVGWQIVDGRLATPSFEKKATVCVYLVPSGYPVDPKRDQPIKISAPSRSELYYASVNKNDGVVKTTGSRSIALLGKGLTVGEAREMVYSDIGCVEGDLFYRKDIGKGVGTSETI
jgi:phosphoribosylamine--glycine ligase